MNLESAQNPRSGIDLDEANLYTLQMCSSREEWLRNAGDHPVALDGAEPLDVLSAICERAEGSAAYPACQEAAEPWSS